MKKLFVFCLILISPTVWASDWKLIWSDEFDKPGLPDSQKWEMEEGFLRNQEMQYYKKGDLKNSRVEDGNLIIESHKEKTENPNFKSDSDNWKEKRKFAEYTSASLLTRNQFKTKYGRIEMRAKLPSGKGIWPAFWTCGSEGGPWPQNGEIDIMEFLGREPRKIHGTVHYSQGKKHKSKTNKFTAEKSPALDFHIYAIEWTPEKIDFFYDDEKFYTFNIDEAGKGNENPFRKPHFLRLNLALGGNWAGPVDDTILPQQYLIDYVRVYQQEAKAE